MSASGRVPRAIRLSQHLDLEGQLEVLQLKVKLQEMTEVVQQLLQHLAVLEKMSGIFSKGSPQKGSVATQTSNQDDHQWDKSSAVKEKMKELVDMNINWQKYNALQEKHIHELNDKVQELTQQLHEQLYAKEEQLHQIEELQKENLQLKTRVEQLSLRLNKLPSSLNNGQETSEREILMAAQLTTFKEDFEMERKDREKAQARIVELENELLKLKKQMWKFMPDCVTTSTATDGDQTSESSFKKPPSDVQNVVFRSGDLAVDAVDGLNYNEAYLPSRSGVGNTVTKTGRRSGMVLDLKEDILCCPKCFEVFRRQDHSELLDHIERCHDQSKPPAS